MLLGECKLQRQETPIFNNRRFVAYSIELDKDIAVIALS